MFELRPFNQNHQTRDLYYNPFRTMEEFENQFFGRNAGPLFNADSFGSIRTDVRDDGDKFLLEADLPGFDKKDIHLDLNGDVLTIDATRHSEHEDKDSQGRYLRCERSYGSYRRSFSMDGIDTAAIRAQYTDGVLHLTLPKLQPAAPEKRALEIE